jgi:hypothetical protein
VSQGIKSVVRKCIIPNAAECIRDSGLDVTRVNTPEAIIRSDPQTSGCMDGIDLWFGPNTTIAACPIRRGNKSSPDLY